MPATVRTSSAGAATPSAVSHCAPDSAHRAPASTSAGDHAGTNGSATPTQVSAVDPSADPTNRSLSCDER